MTPEPAARLAAATRRRAAQTRERARTTLRQMDREGATINYTTVANTAGVSRALLYRDPELRAEIDKLRATTRPSGRGPHPPAAQRMTPASQDELLATLRAEVRTLRQENQALRDRLANVLGDERATTQGTNTVSNMSLT